MEYLKHLSFLLVLISSLFNTANAAIATLADTATQNPLGGGLYTGFAMDDYSPAVENGQVIFVGGNAANPGSFFTASATGGTITSVLNYGETMPDEPSVPTPTFYTLGGFSLDHGTVAFTGAGWQNNFPATTLVGGIYTKAGGILNRIANTHIPVPNNPGSFLPTSFGSPSSDAGQVVFSAISSSNSNTRGIYVTTPAGLFTVADISKTIPGSTNLFPGGFEVNPCLDAGDVTFSAQVRPSGSIEAIFKTSGGATNSLQTVVDTTSPVPGAVGNFGAVAIPVISQGQVAFWGRNAGFLKPGIYTTVGGGLHVVADQNTAIPGGTGNFIAFDNNYSLCIKSNRVVFLGYGNNSLEGIYLWDAGQLSKIVDSNDDIGGRNVRHVYFGKEAFDGTAVAFVANFDGAYFQGVYTVPINPTVVVPAQFTLKIAKLDPNSVRLSWLDSIVGAQVETSTNLFPGSWTALASGVIQTNGENVVVQPLDLPKRFYRLVQP